MGEGHAEGASKILIGVILLLLIVIPVTAFIYVVIDKFNSGTAEITGMANTAEEKIFTKYDGVELSGSDVVAAVGSLEGQTICVSVNNGKSTTEYIYKANLTDKADGKIADMKSRSKDSYVAPTAKYLGSIERDDTDRIVKVIFEKQK